MALARTVFGAALFAGATLAASQAMAAEPFNGPYIGAELGWQQNKMGTKARLGAPVYDVKDKDDAFAYGAVLGYDAKVGSGFVLGAEASVSGNDGTVRGPAGLSYDTGRTLGLAARAGVLAGPETLVYGRGGWVNTRFTVEDAVGSRSSNRDGWTLGGGVEHMLTQNVSLKGEYRYSEYKSFPARTLDVATNDATASPSRHQLMAGVNVRF
ncbi:outer membrane protein [Sandaracinobacteroides sp. A072]|uniref:outer membrane protein n=1 Tax=Sandaracinobacteroides sp. A072 TaxID=3461146 RepID=UPI004041988D